MTKVFEREVSKSLRSVPLLWYHKCPDMPYAGIDKVDFLGVFDGKMFGIEAKETENLDSVPASVLTPNQRNSLRSIHNSGGLAVVLINYQRKRSTTQVGFAAAFYGASILSDEAVRFNFTEGLLVKRVTGGWDLRTMLTQIRERESW